MSGWFPMLDLPDHSSANALPAPCVPVVKDCSVVLTKRSINFDQTVRFLGARMPDALAKGGEAKDPGAREESPKDESGPGHIRLRNRALILAAAEEVFATQGYRGATTAAIAQKAGLPKANVHYYFGTKATLYRSSEEHTAELQSRMRITYAVF